MGEALVSRVSRLRRSRARALPLLNRKKKGDCSQSTLCSGETGKKEKESVRGTMGRGKREKGEASAFSLFPSFAASFLIFDYCYFHWDTQREPLRRREILSHLRPDRFWEARSQSFSLRKWKWGKEKFWGGGGETRFSVIESFLITFVRYY